MAGGCRRSRRRRRGGGGAEVVGEEAALGGAWADGVEDAVELPALARRRPLEDDFGGAWGGAVRRRCEHGAVAVSWIGLVREEEERSQPLRAATAGMTDDVEVGVEFAGTTKRQAVLCLTEETWPAAGGAGKAEAARGLDRGLEVALLENRSVMKLRLHVEELMENSSDDIDIAWFSAGWSISKKFSSIAPEKGTIVELCSRTHGENFDSCNSNRGSNENENWTCVRAEEEQF
ncbi:hypothetical protein SASPL_121379 [Salvia splendens]|uniref:Uncharacterized protein n=1 Tax=Salvia splendens TaxID=180675 RepID=A0A8X8XUU7_SALSN|nr:hypothetical protein SASPL_121379 [Salvia splendens]